jgi:hypothetical protein
VSVVRSKFKIHSSLVQSPRTLAGACVLALVPALSACGSSGAGGAAAPFSNIYAASYAAPGKTVSSTLANPGNKMEGVAVGLYSK